MKLMLRMVIAFHICRDFRPNEPQYRPVDRPLTSPMSSTSNVGGVRIWLATSSTLVLMLRSARASKQGDWFGEVEVSVIDGEDAVFVVAEQHRGEGLRVQVDGSGRDYWPLHFEIPNGLRDFSHQIDAKYSTDMS